MIALGLAVFFLSGLAALLYQVIWQRMLVMFSGADVYSTTMIVAAFMAGLGIGSLAGGHIADHVARHVSLVLFAVAEAAIAAFSFVSAALYYICCTRGSVRARCRKRPSAVCCSPASCGPRSSWACRCRCWRGR